MSINIGGAKRGFVRACGGVLLEFIVRRVMAAAPGRPQNVDGISLLKQWAA